MAATAEVRQAERSNAGYRFPAHISFRPEMAEMEAPVLPVRRFWQPYYWWDRVLDYFEKFIIKRRNTQNEAKSAVARKCFAKRILTVSPITLDFCYLSESLQALTCPVCLELATPPLRLCQVGHFVCGRCLEQVKTCPVCRNTFTEARNFALEGLTSMIEVKCRNRPCNARMKLDHLPGHLAECEYRPVACNIAVGKLCHGRLIDFFNYPNHLSEHRINGSLPSASPFSVPYTLTPKGIVRGYGTWIPRPFIIEGYRFILNLEIKASVLFIWVSMMASRARASKYFAEIVIGYNVNDGKMRCKRNFKWILDVVPIHTEASQIFNLKYCAKIPFVSLKDFSEIHSDNTHYFHVLPKCLLRN